MSERDSEELVLLNKKLEELFERYGAQKAMIADLKSENLLLRNHIQERDNKIRELEVKYERIRITGALMGEGENGIEAKRKINELVREIDRCVALLNS
ncbi:MAG: hypothetical protein RBT38_01225 [Bacteroidales bacterium]|jgi:chromosome segregation ATPase|nr:hypothetical protein [Bacteroidales bacterium]